MRISLMVAGFSVAALMAFSPVAELAVAQAQQLPSPPNGFRPPPPPPPKPYQPVAATPPSPYGDASFQAFRQQLLEVAARKDRAALAKMFVAQGFFWVQDKDLADKSKPAIDNLAKAIELDAKDGSGWQILAGFASDPTAAELSDHKGIVCAPADPTIDPKQFEALIDATRTDPSEWGYPTKDGLEVRAAIQPNAPVVDKLGLNLVRVLPDSGEQDDGNPPQYLHVATPAGKSGFVPADAIAPLGGDQICYTKAAGGWKIAGYFGGASQ
jgi:hypothetical protein